MLAPLAASARPFPTDVASDAFAALSPPVTLEDVLERREARVQARDAARLKFGRPVVSFTLVNPGPVKDTSAARFVFAEGLRAIDRALAHAGFAVLAARDHFFPTGPEALRVVDADAVGLKRTLLMLEDRHPLGRLWDADVIDADGAGISRRGLGLAPRACLVCNAPAHACARAGTHPLTHLQRAIQECIDAYRATPAR